jgi:hypothetical protein
MTSAMASLILAKVGGTLYLSQIITGRNPDALSSAEHVGHLIGSP